MNNLAIDYDSSDTDRGLFYVLRKDVSIPWPSNSTLAIFVSRGKFTKFKILTTGEDNLKIVKIKISN